MSAAAAIAAVEDLAVRVVRAEQLLGLVLAEVVDTGESTVTVRLPRALVDELRLHASAS